MSNCYTVGFAKVDITPINRRRTLCSTRHTLFEGVHDPLYARVITVSDSKEQAVIIGTDTIGIANAVLGEDRNYTSEVRKKIAEKTGYRRLPSCWHRLTFIPHRDHQSSTDKRRCQYRGLAGGIAG